MKWQLIENAPDDNSFIVVACLEDGWVRYREVARFEAGRWMLNDEDELTFFSPSHWLPLSQYRVK